MYASQLMKLGVNSIPTYKEAMKNGDIEVGGPDDTARITKWNHPDIQPDDATIRAQIVPIYGGQEITTKSDVDYVTKTRIMSIFGSLEGELKYMREMITGVHDNSKNLQVQAILDEGNAFIIDNNLV